MVADDKTYATIFIFNSGIDCNEYNYFIIKLD